MEDGDQGQRGSVEGGESSRQVAHWKTLWLWSGAHQKKAVASEVAPAISAQGFFFTALVTPQTPSSQRYR